MNYHVTQYFFYTTIKLEFTSKKIIKEVKMCTVKITIITTYQVIKPQSLHYLVWKANAKGSASGFEIAPPSKDGGSDKHLAVDSLEKTESKVKNSSKCILMAISVLFLKVKTNNVSIKRSAIDKTDGNYFNLFV